VDDEWTRGNTVLCRRARLSGRYSPFTAAEIVFSGGERVLVPSDNADEVMARMATEGSRDHQARGGVRVRPGFIDFESDQGTIYIRPDQVAYVCEAPGSSF
jgi:hypothetical protein